MGIVILQFITAISLGCFALWAYIMAEEYMRTSESVGETVWLMEYQGQAGSKIIELPEKNFLVGTGFNNDIRIKCRPKGVRFYMNVQKKEIALTVLKGKIQIGNYTYKSDETERIVIADKKTVLVGNAKIIFRRKRG